MKTSKQTKKKLQKIRETKTSNERTKRTMEKQTQKSWKQNHDTEEPLKLDQRKEQSAAKPQPIEDENLKRTITKSAMTKGKS